MIRPFVLFYWLKIIFRFYVIGLLLIGVILIAKPPFLMKIAFPHDNTFTNPQVRKI